MEPVESTIWMRILDYDDPLGSGWVSFLVLTIVAFGFGAMMMGRALAETWRPVWQNVAYGLLLGVGNRLFHNFFVGDDLLNLPSYIIQTAVLVGIALLAYRATLVQKMVTQYPWLYARAGVFRWRKIS